MKREIGHENSELKIEFEFLEKNSRRPLHRINKI